MLAWTRDGLGLNAPREIIHLLNQLKDAQLSRITTGQEDPEGENLFHRSCFKEAMQGVSSTRLQTFKQEYPTFTQVIDLLKAQKTNQSVETLRDLWGGEPSSVKQIADKLHELGFFQERGVRYEVPLLFRQSLGMVRGKAE
jgi:hypothetical protein